MNITTMDMKLQHTNTDTNKAQIKHHLASDLEYQYCIESAITYNGRTYRVWLTYYKPFSNMRMKGYWLGDMIDQIIK